MKAWYVLVAVFLLAVVLAVGFFVGEFPLTGKVVRNLDEYSYTRAVCSGDECIDVIVSCNEGDVVGIEPVFYLVDHEDGWEDPRGDEGLGFCG